METIMETIMEAMKNLSNVLPLLLKMEVAEVDVVDPIVIEMDIVIHHHPCYYYYL